MAHERFVNCTNNEFSSRRQRNNVSEIAAVLAIDALILGASVKAAAECFKVNRSMSGKGRKD